MVRYIKNIYHFLQAVLANIIYGFPSRGMTIIGVTGTDGKTTTASLIYQVLVHSGQKAALISSVGAMINDKASDIGFHVTTPGRFAIQSYLKRSKKAGVKYVVLEVTSHALDQHRVAGVHFDIGVITNITKEHLDYHKTFEKYVKAKAKLLKHAKVAILNKDDASYLKLKKNHFKNKEKKIITYGFKRDSDVNPHVFPFKTKLIGRFNEYNCLAAIAVLRQLHISDENIRAGIISFKAPAGRQDVVYNKDFMVVNDFAHTPNSFANIVLEAKKLAKNRLIHVFGSAGQRDKYKRPEMGKISSQYADVIILTAEDPRDEATDKISSEILSGISDAKFKISPTSPRLQGTSSFQENKGLERGKKYLFQIPDRKEAVEFAIGLAEKGDVVLLTGKGHEKSMNYGKGEEPWNESEVAREAIKKLRS